MVIMKRILLLAILLAACGGTGPTGDDVNGVDADLGDAEPFADARILCSDIVEISTDSCANAGATCDAFGNCGCTLADNLSFQRCDLDSCAGSAGVASCESFGCEPTALYRCEFDGTCYCTPPAGGEVHCSLPTCNP